jgi:4-hydroxy-tetrahydrodipicolinate synthase
MAAMKLTGVIPPIGTPLTGDDRVDEAGLRRLNRYLLGAGVDAIFGNGSMGGFAFLTDDEQVRSLSITVSEVNGKVPVLAGIGETSTTRAIRLAKRMVSAGVDYLTLLPPSYFLASQQQLIAYFSAIAEAVDLPIFLYDNPALTKNPIRPETVAELRRRIPRIVGIKVSNQDCINLQNLLTLMRGDAEFSILTGSEFLTKVHLEMGCDGFVGGSHNLCPHMAVAFWQAHQRGDRSRVAELQQDLIATWQVFTRGSVWGAFDEALRHLGICDRATGHPYLTKLTEAEAAEVRAILDHYVKPYL